MPRIIHRMSKTKIYKVFDGIKRRCNDVNHRAYKSYGGRGIKCEWTTFEEFYNDIGKDYIIGVSTIDRINNDGNYCKENCRLSNMKEQSRNTRRNRMIEYKGETKCLAEWLEIYGIDYEVGRQRLLRMPFEDVINMKYIKREKKNNNHTYKGLSIKEWALKLNINKGRINALIRRGRTFETAIQYLLTKI